MTRYAKPAEVYIDGEQTMIAAENIVINDGYVAVWEKRGNMPVYYPWHRIDRVQRLPANGSNETASSPAQSDTDTNNDVVPEEVVNWLTDLGIPQGEYEVFEHEEFGSINISPSGQVDWWNDVTDELRDVDDAWWNGDDRVWIIQDVGEVVG